MSKAFDKVHHNLLFDKLHKINIPFPILSILKNLFSNRKQIVISNGVMSNAVDVTSGLVQGSILGPVLFNVFINSVFELQYHGYLSGYADDLKLLSFPGVQMQEDREQFELYIRENKLAFNLDKLSIMDVSDETEIDKPFQVLIIISVIFQSL